MGVLSTSLFDFFLTVSLEKGGSKLDEGREYLHKFLRTFKLYLKG